MYVPMTNSACELQFRGEGFIVMSDEFLLTHVSKIPCALVARRTHRGSGTSSFGWGAIAASLA